jgi:phenylalanyl-tRNA synthetase alpha chain
MHMKDKLEAIRDAALQAIADADTPGTLEEIRVGVLGRKGELTDILRGLKDVSPEDRPLVGQLSNQVKQALTEALTNRKSVLESAAETAQGADSGVDITLPGRAPRVGHMHPISQVLDDISDIFTEMGFTIASGPDIETEYYNFDGLNTPKDHPARDSHDTFYVKPGVVLRTHTSPVQVRVMESTPPPVAVVVPGRTYRVDNDASHSPMFFQFEGLLVDEGVTFADLKGTLLNFAQHFFGKETRVRFRPHFFPFTEPSAEMDISCTPCNGKGCRVCKNSGWLELLGCGMVHPEVFKHAGYDYEKYSGFAFGMGIDRAAMLRHSIDSISHLYENDIRFLEQF